MKLYYTHTLPGAVAQDRTADLALTMGVLYQLSYNGERGAIANVFAYCPSEAVAVIATTAKK